MDRSENERLCRVGPGTIMGELVRRYWVPICMSSDLLPGGAPLRQRIFGERLVVFRNPSGDLGLLDERCPHRGASLALGRNEEDGLRCLFHGWKINSDGRLVDAPNVDGNLILSRLEVKSYPIEEAAGVVWGFLGPSAEQPPRPSYGWEGLPFEHTLVVAVDLDCNWLQSLEGLLDSSHATVLHTDVIRSYEKTLPGASDASSLMAGEVPKIEVEATDFGFFYAAIRRDAAETGADHVRVSAYAAPFLCFIPPAGQAFMTVPLDDEHTRFYHFWWSPMEILQAGPGREQRFHHWGVTKEKVQAFGLAPIDWSDPDSHNALVQDRQSMDSGVSFTGFRGVTIEDAAVSLSMGSIASRSHEHLVASDLGVIRLRRFLLEAALAVESGRDPVGIRPSHSSEIGAASGRVRDGDWRPLVGLATTTTKSS